MAIRKMRPGDGWKYLGNSVWEHTNGSRIHLIGLIRFQNNNYVSVNTYPDSEKAELMIRINGGNRKRGLMALAMHYEMLAPISRTLKYEEIVNGMASRMQTSGC